MKESPSNTVLDEYSVYQLTELLKLKRSEMQAMTLEFCLRNFDAFKIFCRQQKGSLPKRCFPTPANARWRDLSIRFRDGHVVIAQIGDVRSTLSYRDLGMEDTRTKEPNRQWRLLYAFADERGRLDWSSKHAHSRNQKQKEILVRRLKAYFGIPGCPIQSVYGNRRWDAVFVIEII